MNHIQTLCNAFEIITNNETAGSHAYPVYWKKLYIAFTVAIVIYIRSCKTPFSLFFIPKPSVVIICKTAILLRVRCYLIMIFFTLILFLCYFLFLCNKNFQNLLNFMSVYASDSFWILFWKFSGTSKFSSSFGSSLVSFKVSLVSDT